MNKPPKLCINCKHCVLNIDFANMYDQEKYAKCDLTAKVNFHDGQRCMDRRRTWLLSPSWFDYCGPKALQFEPIK